MRVRQWQGAAAIALVLMSTASQQGLAQQAATPQPPGQAPASTAPNGTGAAAPQANGAQSQPAAQIQPQTQTSPDQAKPTGPVQNDTTGTPGLPQAPQPKLTEPLYLRDTGIDYTVPKFFFNYW